MFRACTAAVLFAATAFAGDKAKELVEDVCTTCHTMTRVKTQELSKDEWSGLIKGMISEGGAVSDEEFAVIVDYLAKNFGEKRASR